MVRAFHINDAPQLLDIYNYYVLNTTATFDLEALSLDVFTHKLETISAEYPIIVFEEDKTIIGYAYGSKFRPKPAYHYVVESTVYVKPNAHGKKIGTTLYAELLKLLKQAKFHTVLGVLTIPNTASIKLHEKFGFKQVAHLEEVGFKFGEWQYIGIWQLKLE
ncbi:GNAT family N-acetyltransferase [Algibacter pectinivorans]|uniref:Phosphinothricin acetyltransferase n=1 Tax=Algibacter pectinivorans TaxID=870482 RepID=A0A1I1QEW8_9FLAO|nr:GNAT family N-acetyltransferase [Algibacter pectinivorans]SFD20636.1 phosphinothricin acetyltransferase [Algibacter pectinivorans]